MGTSTRFVHTRLSSDRSIRLLHLLPSVSFDSPIRCRLGEVSLDDDVKFEALSYVWGDPVPGHTVLVDGDETLEVTPSCLEALRYLRWRVRRRVLWVDAICIDQGKDDDGSARERNHQVKLMGDAYSKATCVLAWLGPGGPSTRSLFAKLNFMSLPERVKHEYPINRVSAITKRIDHKARRLKDAMTVQDYCRDPEDPHDYQAFSPAYSGIVDLLRHPWWYRVWTLQEQVFARQCELVCGRSSISITTFLRLVDREAANKATADQFDLIHLPRVDIHQLINHDTTSGSYFTRCLFGVAFHLQATFALDKIYGLYSALKISGLSLSDPDYTKTPSALFEEVTWAWMVRSGGDSAILQLAGRPPDVATDCPSWVPLWHIPLKHHLGRSLFVSPHHTQTRLSKIRNLVHKPGTLQLHGWYAGKLEYSRADGDAKTNEERRKIHRDWCLRVYEHDPSGGDEHGTAMRELVETMDFLLGRDHFTCLAPAAFAALASWFDMMIYPRRRAGVTWTSDLADQAALPPGGDLVATLMHLGSSSSSKGDHASAAAASAALRALEQWETRLRLADTHALCMLDDGTLGWADHWSRPGDEVYFVADAATPFVLRRHGDVH